jgi:hypothetical protein
VVVVGAAIGGYVLTQRGESKNSKYLKELTAKGVRAQFPNDAAAIANAHRVCTGLQGGGAEQGYARDAVGVSIFCVRYYNDFKVVPTPEEQRSAYLAALSKAGFAGKFSSDESAVAHAQKVCNDLKSGGPQQGFPQDKVAVQVYCPSFLEGYKVLRTINASGTFTLIDSSPSEFLPSITSDGVSCQGSGGYSDIVPGTEVTVTNGSGKLLAQTTLGPGSGTDSSCVFSFSVRLTEGEDQYGVSVSHRGTVTFTFSQLDTVGIALTLGS